MMLLLMKIQQLFAYIKTWIMGISIDSTYIISAILYDINDDSDDNMEHESFITCNLNHISIYWYYYQAMEKMVLVL